LAVSPGSISECGDEGGAALFNLTVLDEEILAGQDPEVFILSYHASQIDAEAGVALEEPDNFWSQGQPVFVKVINVETGCYTISSMDLVVDEMPSLAPSIEYQGCPPLNLETIVEQMETGLTLSFYTSYEDAVNSTDAITNTGNYDISQASTVYVRAEEDTGCFVVSTLSLFMENCAIPRGISPNGDGLNDELDLSGYNVSKLSIFNRYGLGVYTRSDYTNEWHGQSDSGEELVSGTYYYMAEFLSGETLTGWIYINR